MNIDYLLVMYVFVSHFDPISLTPVFLSFLLILTRISLQINKGIRETGCVLSLSRYKIDDFLPGRI